MLIGDTQTIPAAIAQVYFATRLYISKYHEYDNLGHLLNVAIGLFSQEKLRLAWDDRTL